MTAQYNIALVDDHTLFRSGLRWLLESSGRCNVVLEASDGEELIENLPPEGYDVVLLDIDMPRMNGIEAARRAVEKVPGIKIIALSMHGDEEYYFRMVAEGVKGFLLKNSAFDEVMSAIEAVASGGSHFSRELLFSLVDSLKSAAGHEADTLSAREQEILLLICKGLSNQEIADKLFISKRTVDKHRANILDKTSCRGTASLVIYAIKNGLVEI